MVFSHLEDCLALKVARFNVDWDYVRFQLVFRDPQTCETGLREVSELGPGECVELGSPARREYYWDPRVYARSEPLDDFSEAVASVRAVTQSCIHSWATCHDNLLHQLSGGLDSSIVLRCLDNAPSRPQVTCVNWYERNSPSGDEREFARAVAGISRCELVEREHGAVDLSVLAKVRPTSRPIRHYTAYETASVESALAKTRGASAIFCGALGDTVFARSTFWNAPAEHLSRYGLRRSGLQVALDAAACGGLSVWSVLRHSIPEALRTARSGPWTDYLDRPVTYSTFANTDFGGMVTRETIQAARGMLERFCHPWFRSVEGVSIAKRWMISALQGELLYDGPFSELSDPVTVPVLASQPLAELSLRIPARLAIRGGIDRAVARAAFNPILPGCIARRTTKGAVNSWICQVVRQNRPFIREFLGDGVLAKERLLDLRCLDQVLSDQPAKSTQSEPDVIKHLYNEAWLQHWSSGSGQVSVEPGPDASP